jgi:glycosyltransferase involved in cell wall biosynthesis
MKGRMKILTLTSSFPQGEDDISGKFVKELGIELVKGGNDILVLAPHSPGAERRATIGGLDVRRFRYAYPEKWQRLGGRAMLPQIRSDFASKLMLPFLFLFGLLSLIRTSVNERVDAIHSHWLLPQGLAGAVAHRFTSKPHLLTVHSAGLFALEMLPLRRRIADFIVSNSDRITIVSSYGRKKLLGMVSAELVEDSERKIQIVPMGVDTRRFEGKDANQQRGRYGLGRDDFLILYVGRLSEVKGVEFLIRAMRILEDKTVDAKLLVVGDGPLEEPLKNLVASLELGGRVEFVGRKTGSELDDYFVMADVVVVPSIVTDHGDTEGLPVVILEAMAAGKPVVASDVGGISDAVENEKTGLLTEERAPKDISEAIVRLMSDKQLYDNLAHNALDRANNQYSWSAVSEKFNRLLRDLAEG